MLSKWGNIYHYSRCNVVSILVVVEDALEAW